MPSDVEDASQSVVWQRLLHYKGAGTQTAASSRIINKEEFFLSPEGHHNAALELEATINALRQPIVKGQENEHAWCKYPARALWIADYFSPTLLVPQPHCSEYINFQEQNEVNSVLDPSIEVIFVSGYLGNPASFFGHILLQPKASQPSTSKQSGELLDNLTNFGAMIPNGESSITYIFKGLFGGYKSKYSQEVSYRIFFNYREKQNRDIWIYKISLSQKEHELLIAHLWELKLGLFRYTFALDNCSFEMLELLAVIYPDIQTPLRFWSTPIDVVHAINNISATISRPRLRPSRIRKLRSHFNTLPRSHKQLIRKAFRHINAQDFLAFQNWLDTELPTQDHAQILDIIIQYIGILEENTNNLQFRSMALSKRLELPPFRQYEVSERLDPNEHSRTALLQYGLKYPVNNFHDTNIRPEQLIRANLAYFDLISYGIPIDEKGSLNAFDSYWQVTNTSLKLQKLDVMSVEDLGIGALRIKGDRGVAWRLKLTALDTTLSSYSASYIESAIGTSIQIGSSSALTAMTFLQTGLSNQRLFASGGPELGFVSDIRPWITIASRYKFNIELQEADVQSNLWTGIRFGQSNRLGFRTEFFYNPNEGTSALVSTTISW
ncbi:MAG: DUF4105 domain-containing protein [Myxococcota bacterium]